MEQTGYIARFAFSGLPGRDPRFEWFGASKASSIAGERWLSLIRAASPCGLRRIS
jgi:hypothetical protein